MAKTIMIVKPDTISAKDKEKLTKNGYVVIEHPFPKDVRLVTESYDEHPLILKSLAQGLKESGSITTHQSVGKAVVHNILAIITGQ
jgi:hypothetical protein